MFLSLEECLVFSVSFFGREVPAAFEFFDFLLAGNQGFAVAFEPAEFAEFPGGVFGFRV
jgi:hypothetical protein